MRFITLLFLSAAGFAQAVQLTTIQDADIDVSSLNQTEVSYDANAKAWYLDLAGVFVTNGSTGFAIDKDRGGVTLAVVPSSKMSHSWTTTSYRIVMGFNRADKWPLGATGRIVATSAPSFPFTARIQLPSSYGVKDRTLELIMPVEPWTGTPALPVILNWKAQAKTWKLAYGAVTSPNPFPNRTIQITQFNALLDTFSLQTAEVGKSTPAPSLRLLGAYQSRRCPGDTGAAPLSALTSRGNNTPVVLLETHRAKDAVLDPWVLGCKLDEPGTVEVEFAVPVEDQKKIDAHIAEWRQYDRDTLVFTRHPKADPGMIIVSNVRFSLKKGATAWSVERHDRAVAYP